MAVPAIRRLTESLLALVVPATWMAAVRRRLQARGPRLAAAFPEGAAAGAALRAGGLSVAVAESCTGGLLGAALTAVAGSSDYVRGGVVAYSDALKRDLLAVPAAILVEHGAVSEPVARAMARGVRGRAGADVGVAVTGVAGPGASEAKPAGLVFVALSSERAERVVRLDRDRGREGNRNEAVHTALRLLVEVFGDPLAPGA